VYNSVLAEIHDRWFDSIAVAAGKHIKELVGPRQGLKFLDLGCGSGVLLNQVNILSLQSFGIDISSEMIVRARTRVPQGDFQVANILDAELPPVNVITMVGEILSYALYQSLDVYGSLSHFLKRVYAALEAEGLFIFDVLEDQHDYSGQIFHDSDDWTIHSKVTQDQDNIHRHIVSFIRREVYFQKSTEDHHLRLLNSGALEELLNEVGFSTKRISKYADMAHLPGRIGFECRKGA